MTRIPLMWPMLLLLASNPGWGFFVTPAPYRFPAVGASAKDTAVSLLSGLHMAASSDDSKDIFRNHHDKNHNDNNTSSLNNLSITELKRLLSERGVDFRDCLEKRDLIERLQNSRPAAVNKVSRSNSGNSNNNMSPTSGALDPLTAHEQGIIKTFKKVSPSVAYIQTTSLVQTRRGFEMRGMEVPAGTGSGFLWDKQGHVVTNYHVIAGRGGGNSGTSMPSRVLVKLTGMPRAMEASVVGAEPEKDIAVLKLKDISSTKRSLPDPIDVGTSSDLQVGQTVLAIGNPFGLDDTLTTGVLSALGRDLDGVGGRPIRGCIQTDASINPGNSGGPLLDSRGRLIGVNTAIFSPNRGMAGNVGIGFAIPVDTVTRVVNQIIRFGRTVRPTLGINVVNDRVVKSIQQQLGGSTKLEGVLIAEVLPNSPAVAAGLEASRLRSDGSIELGDLITSVDGEPVKETEDLISAIEEKQAGDIVKLVVWRKANPKRVETVRAKLTTRDKLEQKQASTTKTRTDPSVATSSSSSSSGRSTTTPTSSTSGRYRRRESNSNPATDSPSYQAWQ